MPSPVAISALTAGAVGAALVFAAAPAVAETHTSMPTLYAMYDGGLCLSTINAKVNIFDDSDNVGIGYQTNDVSGTGSAGCGQSVEAVVDWHNLDTGATGTVSRRMFRNETNSLTITPGAGRIEIELTTGATHFPDASRITVDMHG
ncbi:hypothetical protein [Nocardia nova]|uniref:hypothetical protein n=1 Tax=Nocardia nova TaxID=37330 RepID=UPI0033C55A3A